MTGGLEDPHVDLAARALRLAERTPSVSLVALAELIDPTLVGVEVRELLLVAARHVDRVEWLARDLLVREISHWLPAGWSPEDDRADVRLASALAAWQTHVDGLVAGADAVARSIFDQRHDLAGWLPTVPDDERLTALTADLRAVRDGE